MHDSSTGESGSANIPPFPRAPTGESGGSEGSDPAAAAGAGRSSDTHDDPLPGDTARPEGSFRSGSRFGNAASDVRQRAARGALSGLDRLAERIDEVAERIERIAEGRLNGAAGEAARATVERLEGTADFLRTSDLNSLRSDLERQVRARPLQSVVLAVGAGWLLGKIMR
jgi:hypothetical protein